MKKCINQLSFITFIIVFTASLVVKLKLTYVQEQITQDPPSLQDGFQLLAPTDPKKRSKNCLVEKWEDGRNFWMMETGLSVSQLKAHVVCAIESFARVMNDYCLRFLFVTPKSQNKLRLKSTLDQLLNYLYHHKVNNIEFHQISFEYIADSVGLHKMKKMLLRSHYYVTQSSDIVRLILTAKYGGFYSDSDVMLIQDPTKFDHFLMRSHSSGRFNSAVMKVAKNHSVMNSIMDKMKSTFSVATYFSVLNLMMESIVDFCDNSCHVSEYRLRTDMNSTLKCCNINVLGYSGECKINSPIEEMKSNNCHFYHHAQSFLAKYEPQLRRNISLETDNCTAAQFARQSCPATVKHFKRFENFYSYN